MKTQIKANCVILLIMAAAFGFFSCQPTEEPYVTGTEAKLTGLTIGSISVREVPEPIDSFDYDDEGFGMFESPFKTAALNRDSDTVLARFKPVVSRGARVEWGIGNQNARPFTFKNINVPATFDADDFLYFRVTSEDGEITRYYRFYAWVRSPVTDMANVYIGDYETDVDGKIIRDERMWANMAEGGNTWSTAATGSISIRTIQAANATVEAVPFDSTAKLRYAIAKGSGDTPAFQDSPVLTFTDQDLLYVEVVAQNEVDKAIYKFRVDIGRIATVKTLLFIDNEESDKQYEILGKGTPASRWNNMAPGSFETADQPASGFKISIEPDDPAATVEWASTTGSEPGSFPKPSTVIFNGANKLAIKVVSDNGLVTRFYSINVGILAASFIEQPRSAYYYYYNANTKIDPEVNNLDWYEYVQRYLGEYPVNPNHPNFSAQGEAQVEELSVTLDRSGNFTYQWYEANSWYGGYGFDEDGRILYYLPENSTPISEKGFKDDDYHVEGFDEKANVSLHNGGNQFYRMENPGRKIEGATLSTYKPDLNKRPFIDGFTSETHYYWVVVTDTTGRTATSKRAVIVSERDPTKKHHIVDVNHDLWEEDADENKIVHPPRNPKAFTYMRESRHIPIVLPDDFNVNDYTVAVAQALFFLKDGTPWIQNWTQGDVGFSKGEGNELIIYYNLTNNNATLGLVGGGKEPQGGSLEETPTHVVLKPAGEKPVNQMPPFKGTLDAWGRPIPENINDAQGWFTAYIELVELRFEGPAR